MLGLSLKTGTMLIPLAVLALAPAAAFVPSHPPAIAVVGGAGVVLVLVLQGCRSTSCKFADKRQVLDSVRVDRLQRARCGWPCRRGRLTPMFPKKVPLRVCASS